MPLGHLPSLLSREDAAPEDGNLQGTVWGRASRTGREFKTQIHDKSGENFRLLILEKKDEGRCASSLQTFKGNL